MLGEMNFAPDYPGFLIAIEGIDGTGKSTQAQLLHDCLAAHHFKVIRTKEPTTGKWGQMLRDSAVTGRLSIEEEVETFIKDRHEHVDTKILPHLRDGFVVIVDRYYFSTAAYQGARGIDPGRLIRRNEEFAPEPDLLVLMDLDVGQGLERVRGRGERADHFEQTDALRRVREIFLGIKKPYLRKIDASRAPEAISAEILREFSRRYSGRMARIGVTPGTQLNKALRTFAHA
jgi:dTMP kinase